jgi:kynureninase
VPALYAAREGPRIVRRAGVEAIREKSLRQTGRLLQLARERGFRSATPIESARRGGAVAVDFDRALEVSRELNARDVVVDYRPGAGIRLSPPFYTADEEVDSAFATIDGILASGEWRRWTNQESFVT